METKGGAPFVPLSFSLSLSLILTDVDLNSNQ